MEQESQEIWDNIEIDQGPEGEGIDSTSTSKNGERRGSTGAIRSAHVAESRDSLQTESTQPKPIREAVKFDLTQPWQRSLLRELDQIENSMLQDEETAPRPRPHADRVLLGHAESGDYMLECEDDISTATDTSSTCPVRLQIIHRHQFPMRQREESPEPYPIKYMDIRHSPKGVYDEVALALSSPIPGTSSQRPTTQYLAHPKLDHSAEEGFRPIPHALPSGRKLSRNTVSAELYRANAFSEEAKPGQSSRYLVEEEPSVTMDYTDPACLCMGYSSLIDLLLFNDQPSSSGHKKKRRKSLLESPPVSRRSSLGRVEEEEDATVGLNPFCMPNQSYAPYRNVSDLQLHEYRQHY